jgi:hypothetical protein
MTRLARVRPFVLYETMVPAAAPSPLANAAIERYIAGNKRRGRRMLLEFLRWLNGPGGAAATPVEMQRRFTLLRLRFNMIVSQYDIFADVMTQRSEHNTGVWLSGLDSVATDALRLPGGYYEPPPVVCYLDRGHGAAIRRARTRLPGGGDNPVAIIRVPRERMVGSGIASSLVHEVGHQAAAILELVPSLRVVLQNRLRAATRDRLAWTLWERWISEIVADFWSVARVGIASTMGLIGVVSLPRAFVFRLTLDDPHPTPWIRVKLSCAMGARLYPHPQWSHLSETWESFYPIEQETGPRRIVLEQLLRGMDEFVSVLVDHRPRLLRGSSLGEVMQLAERTPRRLTALWSAWKRSRTGMRRGPPSLVFAAIGQARANGAITPEEESRLVADLLTWWALRDALDVSAMCAEGHPITRLARLAAAKRELSASA